MTYTHKPTDLKVVDPDTDRTILFNGELIGRVYIMPHGPAIDEWRWFCQWIE